MTVQYSPKAFLRHTPNKFLSQYFAHKGLLTHVAIGNLAETDIDPIHSALDDLSDQERSGVDNDFQAICELACEEGIQILMEEGGCNGEDDDFIETLSSLDDFYSQAMWAFLERRSTFDVSWLFLHADHLSQRYWRKRLGLPAVSPPIDGPAIEQFGQALSAYFRQQQGRGRYCKIDVYQRDTRTYYFAFLEDYGRQSIEFDAGAFRRRPHRPAFEAIFVYAPTPGTLDIFIQGKNAIVTDLQLIFGRVVLGAELAPPPRDGKVYELNCFKDRDVRFVFGPESGIEDVRVRRLRFSIIGGKGRNIILTADNSRDHGAVYDLVDEVFDTGRSRTGKESSKIPLALTNVTQVGLQAYFAADDRHKPVTKTFDVSYPNACSLKHDAKGNLLRQVLIDSGIEPVNIS